MKLEIDTSKDSPEDIRRAVEFLKQFTSKGDAPEQAAAAMSMFDEPKPEKPKVQTYNF